MWSCMYITEQVCGQGLQVYCVCVCAHTLMHVCASVPRGPLIFPALLYERSSSERPPDVEAMTFLVAAASGGSGSGVKRQTAPQSSTSASTRTDPSTHASTSGAVLLNRLTTDHTRYPICSSTQCLQLSELRKSTE